MHTKKIHIATSREIGGRCIWWAKASGYELSSMEDCDIFVSVMYDKLIPDSYIKTRPCFNFHPGILPWYRGAGAYSWAIMNGEIEAGVTLHEIDKDIDHGRVISIERFPITNKDTAETLFTKAEKTLFDMFQLWLPRLVDGKYESQSQVKGRIYYRKDLNEAKDLTRFARAFSFKGKDNAFYINNLGEKVEIRYN